MSEEKPPYGKGKDTLFWDPAEPICRAEFDEFTKRLKHLLWTDAKDIVVLAGRLKKAETELERQGKVISVITRPNLN